MNAPDWLNDQARKVFEATLPKIKDLTSEKTEMLAAYADAMINMRRMKKDFKRSYLWRGAMIYSRNGLGISQPVFVDLMDLMLDSGAVGELGLVEHLKAEWQLPESMRPENYFSAPNPFW